MFSAALTSFLTGITEPIEFSFLFVAPVLYALHALMAGCAQLLFSVLGAKLGFTFSHGFIDFVLYYTIDTKPWLVLLIGPLWGLLYFGVFRWAILHFDLKTPGRDVEDPIVASVPAGAPAADSLCRTARATRSADATTSPASTPASRACASRCAIAPACRPIG